MGMLEALDHYHSGKEDLRQPEGIGASSQEIDESLSAKDEPVSRERLINDPLSVFNFFKNLNAPPNIIPQGQLPKKHVNISAYDELPLKGLILAANDTGESLDQLIWLEQSVGSGALPLKPGLLDRLNDNAIVISPSNFAQTGYINIPFDSTQQFNAINLGAQHPTLDVALDNLYSIKPDFVAGISENPSTYINLSQNTNNIGTGKVGSDLFQMIKKNSANTSQAIAESQIIPQIKPGGPQEDVDPLYNSPVVVKTVIDGSSSSLASLPTVTLPDQREVSFSEFMQMLPTYLEKDPQLSSIKSSIPIQLSEQDVRDPFLENDLGQSPDAVMRESEIPSVILPMQNTDFYITQSPRMKIADDSNNSVKLEAIKDVVYIDASDEIFEKDTAEKLEHHVFLQSEGDFNPKEIIQSIPTSSDNLYEIESSQNIDNETQNDYSGTNAAHTQQSKPRVENTLPAGKHVSTWHSQNDSVNEILAAALFEAFPNFQNNSSNHADTLLESSDLRLTTLQSNPAGPVYRGPELSPENLRTNYKTNMPDNTVLIFSLFILLFTLIILLLSMLAILLCSNFKSATKFETFKDSSFSENDYYSPLKARLDKLTGKMKFSNRRIKKSGNSESLYMNDVASTTCPSVYTPIQFSSTTKLLEKKSQPMNLLPLANSLESLNPEHQTVQMINSVEIDDIEKENMFNPKNHPFRKYKGISNQGISENCTADFCISDDGRRQNSEIAELVNEHQFMKTSDIKTMSERDSLSTPRLYRRALGTNQDICEIDADRQHQTFASVNTPIDFEEKSRVFELCQAKSPSITSCTNGNDFQEVSTPSALNCPPCNTKLRMYKEVKFQDTSQAVLGVELPHPESENISTQRLKYRKNQNFADYHMITLLASGNHKTPSYSVKFNSPSASHSANRSQQNSPLFTAVHLSKKPLSTTLLVETTDHSRYSADSTKFKLGPAKYDHIWQQKSSPLRTLSLTFQSMEVAQKPLECLDVATEQLGNSETQLFGFNQKPFDKTCTGLERSEQSP